ncbi:hypothetical protein BJ684DRAFT_21752 [Piptocephalis cylindrospora]|uniref:Uncharacterized protein n=1 Tax=Piptocephalis cylindrospora TaxID=1907219 RepID=A0A4P9XYZ2_9FUNG|nr:hypothetical protein BJ684DRAFT_21752 [Piptocephalis cylindrospora]|eukprot:RKP11665.1 hypothetical protein BJ684DRAFT_21752 [Piptocephalis cylindrospora]
MSGNREMEKQQNLKEVQRSIELISSPALRKKVTAQKIKASLQRQKQKMERSIFVASRVHTYLSSP